MLQYKQQCLITNLKFNMWYVILRENNLNSVYVYYTMWIDVCTFD